jgi:hypothetical protein
LGEERKESKGANGGVDVRAACIGQRLQGRSRVAPG